VDISSDAFEDTRRRLRRRFGDNVVDPWWDRLPATVAALGSQWDVDILEPAGRGNTSLVLRCRTSAGTPGIVKLTPEPELAQAEASALRRWQASRRVPELWDADPALGAVLMEEIPGDRTVADSEAGVPLGDVADLIGSLHRVGAPSVGDGICPLSDRVEFMFAHWTEHHAGNAATIVSVDQVHRGRDLARRLAAEETPSVLLHGDLHPNNVLDGGTDRGLVAIDPRPCVGDPAFDLVDWVIWPHDHPSNWRPRVRTLAAALGLDADRIWEWCRTFAAMLAATTNSRDGSPDRIAAFLSMAP
jgi:streptomycin 6-kinase